MTLLNEKISIGGRIISFLYFLVSRIVFGLKLTNNAIFCHVCQSHDYMTLMDQVVIGHLRD